MAENVYVGSQGHICYCGTNYTSTNGLYTREEKSKLRWSLGAWEIPCVSVTCLYKMGRNAISTSNRNQECHHLTFLSTYS